MAASTLSIVLCGDLVLDEPDPDHWLSGIAPVTQAAGLTIGHLEVPHTGHVEERADDVPAPGAPPAHLAALVRAGFDVVTLAGNHIADCGAIGIADTVGLLDRLGLAHCGAGMNLSAARAPAVVQAGGLRCAVLSYNCVGPESAWATHEEAGCAYLRITTADGSSVTPTAPLEHPDPASLAEMTRDIESARNSADLVIVALHKGVVHTPARLAPYERPAAHAAIDAGADVVVGHHAHIVRGLEWYRGKPVFHGLGNGCVVTRALSPGQDNAARAAWVERRKQLFGFEPDPAYVLAPFHPQAVNAMLGRLTIRDDGSLGAGFVPVHVEPPGRPVLARGTRARDIADYVGAITAAAGLPPLDLLPHGDEFMVARP